MTEPNLDLPEEAGPVGKPSQAEGEDDAAPEQGSTPEIGKPSQAEGDVGDSDSPGGDSPDDSDSSSDQS
jgi:hypothetical protein